jgi:hypothetical protein
MTWGLHGAVIVVTVWQEFDRKSILDTKSGALVVASGGRFTLGSVELLILARNFSKGAIALESLPLRP